jgi:hypothetical protein
MNLYVFFLAVSMEADFLKTLQEGCIIFPEVEVIPEFYLF